MPQRSCWTNPITRTSARDIRKRSTTPTGRWSSWTQWSLSGQRGCVRVYFAFRETQVRELKGYGSLVPRVGDRIQAQRHEVRAQSRLLRVRQPSASLRKDTHVHGVALLGVPLAVGVFPQRQAVHVVLAVQ